MSRATSIRRIQKLLAMPFQHGKSDMTRRLDKMLDQITQEQSAFHSFEDLVKARGGYVPSIEVNTDEERMVLADAYDAHMIRFRDPRRAYRYGAQVDNTNFNNYRASLRSER